MDGERVAAVPSPEVVRHAVVAAVEIVAAGQAEEGVLAPVAVEEIVAPVAREEVVVVAAVEVIRGGAAPQEVLARAAVGDRGDGGRIDEDVVAAGAVEDDLLDPRLAGR